MLLLAIVMQHSPLSSSMPAYPNVRSEISRIMMSDDSTAFSHIVEGSFSEESEPVSNLSDRNKRDTDCTYKTFR